MGHSDIEGKQRQANLEALSILIKQTNAAEEVKSNRKYLTELGNLPLEVDVLKTANEKFQNANV